LPGVPRGDGALSQPAGEAEADEPAARDEAREDGDDHGRADAGEGDDAHCGPDGRGGVGRGCGGGRERHQGRRVDQAEHEEREADGSDAGAAAACSPHDGDANDLVEAAREGGAGHRRGPARSGQRQRLGALLGGEEAVPAVRLERERKEKEQTGCGHEPEVGARKGPADVGEVAGSEHGDRNRECAHNKVQRQFPTGGTAHAYQPSHRVSHRPQKGRPQPTIGVCPTYRMG
jgi:hypothetical protein